MPLPQFEKPHLAQNLLDYLAIHLIVVEVHPSYRGEVLEL